MHFIWGGTLKLLARSWSWTFFCTLDREVDPGIAVVSGTGEHPKFGNFLETRGNLFFLQKTQVTGNMLKKKGY